MRFFRLLGRVTSVVAGLALLGQPTALAAPPAIPNLAPLAAPAPLHVAGIDPPPGCSFSYFSMSNNTPQAILNNTTITSTIHLAGLNLPIWSVIAQTQIAHTYNSDLRVYLISPHGEHNALTTGNGANFDNVFANTYWQDSSILAVAEAKYANNVNQTDLIPEGAMGAYRFYDGNGDWNLTISDALPPDVGTLNGWTLYVTTLNERLRLAHAAAADSPEKAINDHSTVTATLSFTGTGHSLVRLAVTTFLEHSAPGDLFVMLTAPNGYTTTLTRQNGGAFGNLFYGTAWLDDASDPVTDAAYANDVPLTYVQPEGALGHFVGIDPNGTWTLTIQDLASGDTGTLHYWGINLDTGYCTPVRLPLVTR